jgi:hypothetical protein
MNKKLKIIFIKESDKKECYKELPELDVIPRYTQYKNISLREGYEADRIILIRNNGIGRDLKNSYEVCKKWISKEEVMGLVLENT